MNKPLIPLHRLTILAIALGVNFVAIAPAQAENFEDLRQLLATRDCAGCDLSRAGLVLANLAGANLQGADLRFANLSQANLAGADLTGADLRGASLNSANLMGASLVGANVEGADLRKSYLVQANLLGTRLDLAFLQGAIGLPASFERAENYYALGVIAGRNRNYVDAIRHYNRAIQLDNKMAPAYLGRAIMRLHLVDEIGAVQDATVAAQLFEQQENEQGQAMSLGLIEEIEERRNPSGGGSGLGIDLLNTIQGIGGVLFRLLF
jgi:tetratricopeptide (TPR) repeat protein